MSRRPAQRFISFTPRTTAERRSGQVQFNLEPRLSILIEDDSLSGAWLNAVKFLNPPCGSTVDGVRGGGTETEGPRPRYVLGLARQEPAADQQQSDRRGEGQATAQGGPAPERLAGG